MPIFLIPDAFVQSHLKSPLGKSLVERQHVLIHVNIFAREMLMGALRCVRGIK